MLAAAAGHRAAGLGKWGSHKECIYAYVTYVYTYIGVYIHIYIYMLHIYIYVQSEVLYDFYFSED